MLGKLCDKQIREEVDEILCCTAYEFYVNEEENRQRYSRSESAYYETPSAYPYTIIVLEATVYTRLKAFLCSQLCI
jgi:hypothetical protein